MQRPAAEPGERHRPALGPGGEPVAERRSAIAGPAAPDERTRVRLEPPSHEAIRSGLRSASEPLDAVRAAGGCGWSAPGVARRRRRSRGARPSEAGTPAAARRPTPRRRAGRRTGRGGRAFTCACSAPALGRPQQPRSPGAQLGLRRVVAAVEEVPAQDPDGPLSGIIGAIIARRSGGVSSTLRMAPDTDFVTGLELADRLGELLDRAAELKADRPRAGVGLAGRAARSR